MALPHVAAFDLYNNGIDYEIIVMKHNKTNGDLFFIRTDYLDDVDRRRVLQILRKRDAEKYEAWDLFSQVTLANGLNALEYFHQYVKVRTRSGVIMAPNQFRAGSMTRQTLTQQDSSLNETAQRFESAPPVKKAGRPPKANKA